MRGLIYLTISILVYASIQGAVINKQQAVANDTSSQEKAENQKEPQNNVYGESNPTNESIPVDPDHNHNGNNTLDNSDIKWNKRDETLDSSSSSIEDKPDNMEQSPVGKDSKKHHSAHPENTHKLMTSRRESRHKRNVENEDEEKYEIESNEFENILPVENNIVKVNEEVDKTDACVDSDSVACPMLVYYGKCDDEELNKYCKYSCNLCGNIKKYHVAKVNAKVTKLEACLDEDDHFCPVFAEKGVCGENDKIRNYCKFSCRVCGDDFVGICEDKQKSCSNWASDGLCSEFPDFMLDECKKSCRLCKSYSPVKRIQEITLAKNNIVKVNEEVGKPDACVDIDTKLCRRFAEQGRCTTNNDIRKHCRFSCKACGNGNTCVDEDDRSCPILAKQGGCADDRIRNNCKFSCKVCSDGNDENCEDQHRYCSTWARAGLCSQHPEFMLENCKKSCKRCKRYSPVKRIQETTLAESNIAKVNEEFAKADSCVDRDFNVCPILAKYGECDDNEEIRKNCKYSCDLCGNMEGYYVPKVYGKVSKADACVDVNSKICRSYAERGRCTDKDIRTKCKVSCKACGNGNGVDENCLDRNTYCQAWAKTGTCSRYPEFMSKTCKKSCKLCKSYSPVEPIQDILEFKDDLENVASVLGSTE